MSFLGHGQIYRSDGGGLLRSRARERRLLPPPAFIVSMSLQPGIPWQVALQQRLPPLPRLLSMFNDSVVSFYHHLNRGGEFSTGDMGKIQPALTRGGTSLPIVPYTPFGAVGSISPLDVLSLSTRTSEEGESQSKGSSGDGNRGPARRTAAPTSQGRKASIPKDGSEARPR